MCSTTPTLITMEQVQTQQLSIPQQLQIQEQPQQQYALKWNDFQSSILDCFQRLRDEEDFVDVTLACDQRSFSAHRVVLSACSPYFRKLLKTNPCDHPIVILRDINSEHIECLLSFMYNGEVNVSHDQLPDFLKTANLLQIRGLTDNVGNCRSPVLNALDPTPIDTSFKSNKMYTRNSEKEIFQVDSIETNNFFTKLKETPDLPIASKMVSNYSNNSTQNFKEIKMLPTAWPQWENTDVLRNRSNHLTPPPQKRIKSADLFRAQHGIPSERIRPEQQSPTHDIRDFLSDCDRSMEPSESTLGLTIENKKCNQNQYIEMGSLHAQSADDESNNSNGDAFKRTDEQRDSLNNSRELSHPILHNAFLGKVGSLEQQSALHMKEFGVQRPMEMRVRATDPRPCPKCGKIYRSAHTLRTHLEDKHTICPGYRCVLCGTVAKSRNSLHSHMSRQHRGISTKDLPVLPMPCAFNSVLASRLLAKAGVKISADELHARASPININGGGGQDYDTNPLHNTKTVDKNEESDDDPEDLTAGSRSYCSISNGSDNIPKCYQTGLLNMEQANTTIARIRSEAAIAAAAAAISHQKELSNGATKTNQPLLDLHLLQFISGNTFGMAMSKEHATAATLHAAKMVQLNTLGQGIDNSQSVLLPAQFDMAKVSRDSASFTNPKCATVGLSTEPILRQQLSSGASHSGNMPDLRTKFIKEHSISDIIPPTDNAQSMAYLTYVDDKQPSSFNVEVNEENTSEDEKSTQYKDNLLNRE